jgi:hypothetical protein
MKAIGSLCAFTHLITRFIPLVRDAEMWQRLYNEALQFPSGTLATYCSRGWCRLELLAALAPKKFPTGTWRTGSVNLRFRFHNEPVDPGAGPLLRAEHILNPMTGRYTVNEDLEAVAPLVVALANRYQEYENSGSTQWDRTVDVHKRPNWLREAATLQGVGNAEEEESKVDTVDEFEVDVAFSIATVEANPEAWEATQGAVNEVQLSNKQDAQRQQLALMQQQHAEETRRIQENLRHQQEQLQLQQEQAKRLQQEQAKRMETLQKEMAEQHTQQQLTLSEAAASSSVPGAEYCTVACVQTRNCEAPQQFGCSAEV